MIVENNQPVNPGAGQMFGKIAVGIGVALVFIVIIFISFIFLGSSLDQAVKNSANNLAFSPLVWISFLGIGVISSILGNIILAAIYNIVWGDDYYDIRLMTSSVLAVNLILLIPFLFLYFVVGMIYQDINSLFFVFAFHIMFATFVSMILLDLVKNPNYSGVYVIGNSIGFVFAVLFFVILFFALGKTTGEVSKIIMLFPPILSFTLIPFFSALFEKIYYKFYESGNDFLYAPPLSEIMVDEEEIDEINVDIK